MDLLNIHFQNETFDLFYSSDVFEHLSDMQKAIAEIFRTLKPGGVLLSVFPFLEDKQKSYFCAKLNSNEIEHHTIPEYHDNPIDSSAGSLVFVKPGWDVLEMCNSVGFEFSKMKLIVSAKYGVVSNNPPGVFVLQAFKRMSFSKKHHYYSLKYSGPHIGKILSILALPRSGTTILTSVLGVHSEIYSIYEPWNSCEYKYDTEEDLTIDGFVNSRPIEMNGKSILLLKETSTKDVYIDNMAKLLRSVLFPIERDLIVLFRNPFHVFLSEIQARKEWWDEHDLVVSIDAFDSWVSKSVQSIINLCLMCKEFNAIIVSYEYMMNGSSSIEDLMNKLKVPFESRQVEYEKFIDKSMVRGDVGVSRSPRPISRISVEKRSQERNRLDELLSESSRYSLISRIENLLIVICKDRIVRTSEVINEINDLITMCRELSGD